jgi:hypothetical protein
MHSTARLVAASIAALTLTVLAAPAPATAALPMISAGDRVDYINPKANNQFCTIGYAYTGPDFHTYAVTAGHCGNSDSGYVRDAQTKLTGNVVRAVVSSPRYGGPDYGLIDFGKYSVASVFIGDTPITVNHPQPQVGQSVCRAGVSSGQHCGQITAAQGADQFLTTGLPDSVPGDSGGPVWTPAPHGYAEIIGIWLGEKTTAAGQTYGRFASLASGLQAVNDNSS